MPEGHSVHRVALQFQRDFVGHAIAASSPQGRFAEGAAVLDGMTLHEAKAVGKQMFLGFDSGVDAPGSNASLDSGVWLRVHLGIYGAWDFAGIVSPLFSAAEGGADEGGSHSVGAPRGAGARSGVQYASEGQRRNVRVSEDERDLGVPLDETFPHEPVGAVRVRLLTPNTVADLRGPTACEVLDASGVQLVLNRLGPDPVTDLGPEAEQRFVDAVTRRKVPIGQLLMDQSIVAGIGNVYRAEMLFRAHLSPYTPANLVPIDTVRALWRDWCELLPIGIREGRMLTRLGADAPLQDTRAERYWVYKREGLPCRRCGTNIRLDVMGARKLYWCPGCQN
ncbi:formamidopyrimidine-DNA glycosylase [Alpinimonas psychrophila]|uniref:DNA-(apurinic or apyrimidinic site) lyase n=1 Tax=Alpinimonas psychrophila TaxID=748908 RepID=A0A7W3JTA3_9MICO|nr:endonuclease-8 [Alpinimonas psychrophila]